MWLRQFSMKSARPVTRGPPGGRTSIGLRCLGGKSKMTDPKISVSPVPILRRASRFRPSATLTFDSFEFLLSSIPSSCNPPPKSFPDETSTMDVAPFEISTLPFFYDLLSHNTAFPRRERDRIHKNQLGFAASGFNRKTTIKILAVMPPNTNHTAKTYASVTATLSRCASTALSLCLFRSVSVRQHSSRGWAGKWVLLGKRAGKGGGF